MILIRLVTFLIGMVICSGQAFSADYVCKGESWEPVVNLTFATDSNRFTIEQNQKVLVSIPFPNEAVYHSFNFPNSKTILFQPGWGESIVSLYGKVDKDRAVFDIHAFGMVGQFIGTLTDYKCLLK